MTPSKEGIEAASREYNVYLGHIAGIRRAIEAFIAIDVAPLEARVNELKAKTNFTYCAYCGKEFPIDTDASDVSNHIATCDKHPIVEVKAERDRWYGKAIERAQRIAELEAENQRLKDDLKFETKRMKDALVLACEENARLKSQLEGRDGHQ